MSCFIQYLCIRWNIVTLHTSTHVQGQGHTYIHSRQELCANGLELSALAGIAPCVSFIVEGGVLGNLLVTVGGGQRL